LNRPPSTGRLKIGFTTKSRGEIPVASACVEAVESAARLCAELGHEVVEAELTFDFPRLLETFGRVAAVLGAMSLVVGEMMIGRAPKEEDFERSTWELFQQGKTVNGVQHAMDIEVMRQFSRQIAMDCEPFDVVITPTMPQPPVKLGTFNQDGMGADGFLHLIGPHTAFTMPFNVSGQPAISLPLHWTEDGLPVGVQFAARYAEEAVLMRLAGQIEKARPWIQRRPPVCV
jgi:amidase